MNYQLFRAIAVVETRVNKIFKLSIDSLASDSALITEYEYEDEGCLKGQRTLILDLLVISVICY